VTSEQGWLQSADMLLKKAIGVFVWLMALLSLLAWMISPTRLPAQSLAVALRIVGALYLFSLIPIIALKYVNPPRTSFMLYFARRHRPEGAWMADIAYRWVPLEHIAPTMQLAVIAGEDPLFPRHYGFDWESIFSAMAYNSKVSDHKRGGSGISQQVAKNIFLWGWQSLIRKILEAYLTLLIEGVWPKRRILEMYLNIVQLGQTTFGAEAASQLYFSRSASDLSDKQAALLAAVLPNPQIALTPDSPPHSVRYRQVMILKQMKTLGIEYLSLL